MGPSLSASGLSPVLANPTLELRNSSGVLLLSNDDWQDNAAQAAEIIAAGTGAEQRSRVGPGGELAAGPLHRAPGGIEQRHWPGAGGSLRQPCSGADPDPWNPDAEPEPGRHSDAEPEPWRHTNADPGLNADANPGGGGTCTESFDGVSAPALPAGWVATNPDPGDGTLWVTAATTPDTPAQFRLHPRPGWNQRQGAGQPAHHDKFRCGSDELPQLFQHGT